MIQGMIRALEQCFKEGVDRRSFGGLSNQHERSNLDLKGITSGVGRYCEVCKTRDPLPTV